MTKKPKNDKIRVVYYVGKSAQNKSGVKVEYKTEEERLCELLERVTHEIREQQSKNESQAKE